MSKTKLTVSVLLLLLAGLSLGGQGQEGSQSGALELVLVPGVNEYAGMVDSTIYEENDNTDGGGQHFFAGITGQGNERRALIKFDLSEIPAKSTISSVKLGLTVSRARAAAPVEITVTMHRVLANWGEGEKDSGGNEGVGATANEGDATWNFSFYQQTEWENAGADFVEEASATAKAGRTGSKSSWESDGLVADVQAWINGDAENFGWILIGNSSARRFNSSESNAPAEFRPTLTIRYTPPKE